MRKMLSRESETISFVKIKQLKLFLFAMCVVVAINGYSSEIRGVWVPDPQYTDVLKSYKNVLDFIQNLDSMNFNSVFIVLKLYLPKKTFLIIIKLKLKKLNAKYNDYYLLRIFIFNVKLTLII